MDIDIIEISDSEGIREEMTLAMRQIISSLATLQRLNCEEFKLKDCFDKLSPRRGSRLLSSIQSFVINICGDTNKLQEKVTELQIAHLLSKPSFINPELRSDLEMIRGLKHVSSKLHGADLIDSEGKTYEDKTSVVSEDAKFHANWNFKGAVSSDKKSLEASWLSKMTGSVILKAVDKINCEWMNIYVLHGPFMAKYLSRKAVMEGKNPKLINLGCDRCSICKHYHRIKHLKEYSDRSRKEGEDSIDWKKDWNQIDKVIPSQCVEIAIPVYHLSPVRLSERIRTPSPSKIIQ